MVARVLVDGLDHPEGVAYEPEADVMWAVSDGAAEEVARAPGFVLGLAVDGHGRVVMCVSSDGSLCVWDGEAVGRPVSGLRFPNYPAFAPDGTLFVVSDSGEWGGGNGRLLRVDVDGSVETFSNAVPNFTNGCAVSPDGRSLWVVESYVPVLSRFDLAAGAREEVRRFDGTVLDGLALRADGGMLISCYRPDRICFMDAAGSVEIVAEDPQGTLLAAPTNVCFVGAELDRVVAANLGRRHLTLLDLGLGGAPPHRPAGWAFDAVVAEVRA